MKLDRQHAIETANFLKQYIHDLPDICILSGTGLCDTLEDLVVKSQLGYSQLPNFPVPTVQSHKGKLIYGSIAHRHILMLQGRFHLYEGYSPAQVTFPVRVMQELGVRMLILTNAAGGINPDFSSGDIMIINDHINLTGKNPLTGPNENAWGLRFPDMGRAYDSDLMGLTRKIAKKNRIVVQDGVYAGLLGPSLETPAEIKFLKAIGGDAVGFSTIMEAIAGVHAGMRILGLSLITNVHDPDNPSETTMEAVLETARQALKPFNRLLCDVISQSQENYYENRHPA